jgi:hypothetical protein
MSDEAKPSIPAGPLAIERLALAVENLRADIMAQGAASNLKLTTVLDAIARFDATLKTLAYDHQALKRSHVELVERVAALESRAFRDQTAGHAPPKRKRKR